jgi:hypothetical protein
MISKANPIELKKKRQGVLMYMEQKSGREREPTIKKYEIPIEVLMYLMRLDLAKKSI